MTKAPKLYFRDTALALTLTGIAARNAELILHPFYPALVETFLVEEIIKVFSFLEPRVRIYYFRTYAGAEVDLVVELGGETSTYRNQGCFHGFPSKTCGTSAGYQGLFRPGFLRIGGLS